ncbi:MAG: SH3 domain-containing protein, partial [Polyangiaceae bacterium]
TPSAPSATEVRYQVTGVAANDVLNVREKPDVASKKVYSFAPGVKNIRLTGQHQEKGATPWVEVAFEGGTGWVNRTFLAELHPGGGCNDPEVAATIRAFMKAVSASDSLALKATVSPLRGLVVQPETRPLKFSGVQLDTIFSSPTVLNLGPREGGGAEVSGTFKAQIEPSLRASILKKGAQEKCGKILVGSGSAPSLDSFSGTPVSFFYPGEEAGGTDWLTWIGVIEYVEGKPYFYQLTQYHHTL